MNEKEFGKVLPFKRTKEPEVEGMTIENQLSQPAKDFFQAVEALAQRVADNAIVRDVTKALERPTAAQIPEQELLNMEEALKKALQLIDDLFDKGSDNTMPIEHDSYTRKEAYDQAKMLLNEIRYRIEKLTERTR